MLRSPCRSGLMSHTLQQTKSRVGFELGLSSSLSLSSTIASLSLLQEQRRFVGVDMLKGVSKRSQRDALSMVVRDGSLDHNKQLMESLNSIANYDKVEYRRRPSPWEIVPKYARRRVSDLVGILTSEHRMEMEQIIEDMQTIADVECYVVIVPTVGYVTPQAFAQSIMWNWGVGEPRGNGLLLVISQQEGSIQLIASQGIMEYFHQRFIELVVTDIFQPLVKQGDASYAILQTVYALARQAHEFRSCWQNAIVPLPVKNKLRFVTRVAHHGAFRTWYFWSGLILMALTGLLLNQLLDAMCPCCGRFMARVYKPEKIFQELEKGRQIEYENGCSDYRVFRCQHCPEGKRIIQISRDYHFADKCLKCEDCGYYTNTLKTSIEKLPTKEEDGRKRQHFECQNCRVARDIVLPLFRPLDAEPEGEWYDFLMKQAKEPKSLAEQKLQKPVKL